MRAQVNFPNCWDGVKCVYHISIINVSLMDSASTLTITKATWLGLQEALTAVTVLLATVSNTVGVADHR